MIFTNVVVVTDMCKDNRFDHGLEEVIYPKWHCVNQTFTSQAGVLCPKYESYKMQLRLFSLNQPFVFHFACLKVQMFVMLQIIVFTLMEIFHPRFSL